MLPKPERIAYPQTAAALLLLAEEKIAFARRDLEAFEPRGWPETRLAALETAARAFGKLPTDLELKQALRKVEKKKNTARTTLTTAIQVVLSKARQVYHPESAEYRGYGAARLHQATEAAFALLAEQVASVGLTELTTTEEDVKAAYQQAGLTVAELTAIDKNAAAFRKLLLAVAAAETRRAVATQARTRAGNAVYATVGALCELGKALFGATDAARYNDYLVLDAGPAPAAPKPRGRPRRAPAGPAA